MRNARQLGMAGKLLFPIPERGLAERLYRIKAKTVIVWGESDKLIPPVYGPAFQTGIAGSTLVNVPGGRPHGHRREAGRGGEGGRSGGLGGAGQGGSAMPIAEVNGQRIYYEDTGGTGPPVIFSHGLFMDHEMFAPQVEALKSKLPLHHLGRARPRRHGVRQAARRSATTTAPTTSPRC